MPFGIILLGILSLLLGGFNLLWGMGLSGVGGVTWLTGLFFSNDVRSWGGSHFTAGLWAMFLGLVQIVTGFGLFGRQKWAWLLTLIAAAFSLVTGLIGVFNGSFWSLLGMILPGIIFFYLLRDNDVKRAFGRA
jgi:hypothetical protein